MLARWEAPGGGIPPETASAAMRPAAVLELADLRVRSRDLESFSTLPVPIHECPWHFGGGRTRNRARDGHAADSACRWRAFGCATASGAPMPIRAPWTWMGATPHLGMPRSASGRMEPDSPILPSAAGSLPASSPSGKSVGPMRPWTLVIIGVALTAATVRAFLAPFPGIGGNPVLDLIAHHDPGLHTVIHVWYYAAPAVALLLAGSVCLSVSRVWLEPRTRRGARGKLPAWPTSARDEAPSLVIGELHHPTVPQESERPSWLVIPEKGLYTGVLVVGAVGTGKTT